MYFFRALLDRMQSNMPLQEVMEALKHEVLATTKLPLAIDFLLGELKHAGGFAAAMSRLSHYFTPFQTYLIREAEDERGRFDFRTALAILEREAKYRSEQVTRQGGFFFQFESICRNRLHYDRGLEAMSADPLFDERWSTWILIVRRQIGLVDLADLIYVRSAHYQPRRRDLLVEDERLTSPLFGVKEGRIAAANRQKDPLFLFAAMQRQLGYPLVPRPKRQEEPQQLVPQMARRLERLEMRVKLLEEEQKGGIDLSKFYGGERASDGSV
ncbi:MAG: hypothetical protein KDA92_17850 [Planctomycetales bacterium]|nr:hypothetical protein [Planctomycetales bacterium]MCA9168620.1 hypothetical protein [Planctomycetales bacterium]